MLSFHVKFVQTDRRTTVKQYVPDLSIRGHKKSIALSIISKVRIKICCIVIVWPYNFIKLSWVLTHSHTMTPFDAPGKQAF